MYTRSIQCHNNLDLVSPIKSPNHVIDFYDGQNYGPKTGVDVWVSMDVVLVECGIFYQTFHLNIWFFQFINWVNFRWEYFLC